MTDGQEPGSKMRGRTPWIKPELHKIELTGDQKEALRAADDPMALLLKMKRSGETDNSAT